MEIIGIITAIAMFVVATVGYTALDWQTLKLMSGYMWCKIKEKISWQSPEKCV